MMLSYSSSFLILKICSMVECKIYTLYSGSGGNSTFIRVADSAILIDAGKSARALCNALKSIGEDIGNIDAIFITHEHTDHISALEVISKKHAIPIHITNKSAQKFDCCPDSYVHKNLCRHDILFCEDVGNMRITSFRTPHDSRMSVGYRIEFDDGGERRAIGVATDIGYVSEDIREGLMGCEAVVLESNHDTDMLMTGPYPYDLKLRVASKRGHLSNRECADLATELAQNGTRAFMLAHLSRENNQPDLALDEVRGAICGSGAVAFVAHPDEAIELRIPTGEDVIDAECEIYNPWNA